MFVLGVWNANPGNPIRGYMIPFLLSEHAVIVFSHKQTPESGFFTIFHTMGSSESTLSSSQQVDQITTVTEKPEEGVDPLLQQLRSLKITTPILTSVPTENSLTDILVRKPSPSSTPGSLNPKVLLELFSMYRDWQERKTKTISQRQEDIENKIEVVDALAVKLLQRFNYSVSAMRTTAHHLSGVHPLQVEVGELKGRLTEVISNCDALCKRIAEEGPESLRSSVKPFTAVNSSCIKPFALSGNSLEPNRQHSSSLEQLTNTISSTD